MKLNRRRGDRWDGLPTGVGFGKGKRGKFEMGKSCTGGVDDRERGRRREGE